MPGKTKIMYLLDSYQNPFAGMEGQLLKLIQGLDKSIFSPHLSVFRNSQYLQDNHFICPVSILNIHSMASIHTVITLIKSAKKWKRDGFKIIHIHLNDASIISPPILKLMGFKVIITRLDMGFWYTKSNLLALNISRFFVDAAIANGEAVKNITHKKENIPLKKIHTIYNGYEPYSLDKQYNYSLPNKFNLSSSSKVIGIVANIKPIKRMPDLLHALSLISDKHSNTHIVIVGGGSQDTLKSLAQQVKILDKVHFLGQQNDVLAIIHTFDICVLCSQSEGFSNSIVEYMHCSKPVVCTRVGGNPEIVQDGYNGYLVNVGDTVALSEKLDTLLSNPELISKLGKNAFDSVNQRFTMKKMIDGYTNVYRSLIQD